MLFLTQFCHFSILIPYLFHNPCKNPHSSSVIRLEFVSPITVTYVLVTQFVHRVHGNTSKSQHEYVLTWNTMGSLPSEITYFQYNARGIYPKFHYYPCLLHIQIIASTIVHLRSPGSRYFVNSFQ